MMEVAQVRTLDTLQGSSLLQIQAAMSVLQGHGRDLASYGVRVFGDERPVVVFTRKDAETREFAVRPGDRALLSAEEMQGLVATEKQVDHLASGSLAPILAAAQLFQQQKLQLDHYRIMLMRDRGSYVVSFTDKDAQSGGRGNPGRRLGYEVELSAGDLRVIRSHFMR